MSTLIRSDDLEETIRFECTQHPGYEGSRQNVGVLNDCPGCLALYWVRKAVEQSTKPGNTQSFLRIDVVVAS